LASVSVTTLDLIGQQTETVQVYVNNVLQFYRLTEALVRGASDDSGSSNTVFISQPMAFTVPLHLFVDILVSLIVRCLEYYPPFYLSGSSFHSNYSMVFDHCRTLYASF
jgi:hypothetical protein